MTFIHKKTFIHSQKTFIHEKTFIQRGSIVGLLGLVAIHHHLPSFWKILAIAPQQSKSQGWILGSPSRVWVSKCCARIDKFIDYLGEIIDATTAQKTQSVTDQ